MEPNVRTRTGLVQRAVAAIKGEFPDLLVITDVALDPYTTHGQDGIIDEAGYVMNDETVAMLTQPGAVACRRWGRHGCAV